MTPTYWPKTMMKNKREKENTAHPAGGESDQKAPEIPGAPGAEPAGEPADAAAAQIASLQAELESVKNQLLRRAAEFENYKRRTEENNVTLIRMANESLIVELLSVLDDFDRSLKAGAEHADSASFYNGVELIRGKLARVLEGRGLKRFESAGAPFDVGYHDALLQVPRADLPNHTIIEEIDPGYQLYDKVIRHAKVIVSCEPVDAAESDASSDPAAAEGA